MYVFLDEHRDYMKASQRRLSEHYVQMIKKYFSYFREKEQRLFFKRRAKILLPLARKEGGESERGREGEK